jgi:hypothetical protein
VRSRIRNDIGAVADVLVHVEPAGATDGDEPASKPMEAS